MYVCMYICIYTHTHTDTIVTNNIYIYFFLSPLGNTKKEEDIYWTKEQCIDKTIAL